MQTNVLLVDDEEGILSLMDNALSMHDFKVYTCSSAEEALEMLPDLQDCHVFFLDLQLPDMNGLELCRAIRKERPIDCIYAITGYSSFFDLVNCREAGFDDYFTKPFHLKDIVKAAENAVEKLNRWKGDSG